MKRAYNRKAITEKVKVYDDGYTTRDAVKAWRINLLK